MAYVLTADEVKKLETKVKNLRKRKSDLKNEMIELTSNDPDFLMNSRYHYLKAKIECEIPSTISAITTKLRSATVIEKPEVNFDGETVMFGTKVTLDYEGEVEVISILPIAETDTERNIVSGDSPIAKLILGKKIGETVRLNNMDVKIINVELF